MTEDAIRAIEAILKRGERVELLQGPDGKIKILRIRRETVPVEKGLLNCGKGWLLCSCEQIFALPVQMSEARHFA